MAVNNATSAAKARKLDRQTRALELRRAGKGYTEIASIIGIGKSQAHRLVGAGLADAIAHVAADAVELRAEEVSRLDALLSSVWADARRGNHGAVDRVLRIMERRAKLLGLDAPERREVSGADGGPVKLTW